MPGCCQGATCACVIKTGGNSTVTGSGTANDPFVITSTVELNVVDNATFDLTLVGDGSDTAPYVLSVNYAATAKLDHLPDVDAPNPTNGQVLAWNNSLQKWAPAAPTTAASGSVTHDNSLTGDGSAGTPLAVLAN